MKYRTILTERKGHVEILTLNRPKVLNALSFDMREELIHYMDRVAKDDGVRVLIMTGKGRAFSAGADLNEFKRAYEAHKEGGPEGEFAHPDLPKAFIDFPKPLIAAINGPAVGFGTTVTLNCDIRLASDLATFSCAFVRLGVTPEFGSSYFLPRLIGYGKAAEMVFTAKTIDAREALDMGLVNRVVEHESLLEEAEIMARDISRMPPGAIRMAKQTLRHGYHSTVEQVLDYESLIFRYCAKSEEHYHAVGEIMEKIGASKK